jgi:hypothetical protein
MENKDDSVSFERDIRPLFREIDIDHMGPMGVALDDYAYMSDAANAKSVYEYLTGDQEPRMPIDGPYWTQEQLDLYSRWVEGGRRL